MTPGDTTSTATAGWVATDATFGARLVLIRQKMGWGNIAKAARECGVPTDSWRNWEVDGVEPHRRTTIAKMIATRTGCDYLWLVHGPDRGGVPSTGPDSGTRVIPARKPRSHDVSAHALPSTRPVRQTRPFRAPSRRQAVDV